MEVNTPSALNEPSTEHEQELLDCLRQLRDVSDIYIGDKLPSTYDMTTCQMVVVKVKIFLKRTKVRIFRWDLVKNRHGAQIFGLTKRELAMIRRTQMDLEKVAVY
jgi:hypothetical protein